MYFSQIMKNILLVITIISLTSLSFRTVAAEENSDPDYETLTLQQIVESSAKYYPQIFANYDQVQAAKANLLAAKGFFDVTLEQSYNNKTRGYYDGNSYDAVIEKELGFLGSKIFGGYRKSYNDFADYDGDLVTGSGGEFRAGARFSLLRGRDIDKNRLALILGNLDVEQSEIELKNIKMKIITQATKAYWSWISAGKILQIYEGLYKLSKNRQRQLEIRAKEGDVADIIVVENRKNLLKRQADLVRMRQKFEAAAIYLSLFYRDQNANPISAKLYHLPELTLELSKLPDDKIIKTGKEQAFMARPEIQVIKIKSQQQLNEIKYAKNLLQPQLDVELGASKDQGTADETRRQSNNYVNLNFSLPLQRREAKGKLASAKSKLSAINYQQQLIKDKINVEIDNIMVKMAAISQTYYLRQDEAKLAKLLQIAETDKFRHGASNFFLVNMREQDLAASKAAVIEIFKDFKNANADYKLAIFDLEILSDFKDR